MPEYTLRIRRYTPETGRGRLLGGLRRSTSTATARCSTASCRPRTARTARSASAARAARRSAAPAACASTASPTSPATPTSTRPPRRAPTASITVEPMGNMPVIKDLIVDMDAVHWKKIQRVTPWLLPEGDPPEREYIVPAGVDDRRHADDGLHPVRRLRVGLPVDGGRPAVHRPGRAGQGLPLRRRPARRPARTSACKDLAEDPHGIYDCTHCFNCIEACPKGVAPMSQIMRLRRIAGADYEIDDRNNGHRHEHGVRQEHRAQRPAARGRPAARLLRRQVPPARGARAARLAAGRSCKALQRGKVTPAKALLHQHKAPEEVKRIFERRPRQGASATSSTSTSSGEEDEPRDEAERRESRQ